MPRARTSGRRVADQDAECPASREIVDELVAALEACLESGGLSWEAEQEAEILVSRYKRRQSRKP